MVLSSMSCTLPRTEICLMGDPMAVPPSGEGLAIPIQQHDELIVEQEGCREKIKDTAVGTMTAAGKSC